MLITNTSPMVNGRLLSSSEALQNNETIPVGHRKAQGNGENNNDSEAVFILVSGSQRY